MRILIATDSFKESLSAIEVADSIESGILHFRKDVDCVKIPLADGGEGTVEAVLNAVGGSKIPVRVKDPLMRDIDGFWGQLPDKKTAILEMAVSSGLERLTHKERNPLITTTYGTGQLIRSALDRGCTKIFIGIGGSATNDGGAGMARALGAKLLNSRGIEIGDGGLYLADLSKIDLSGLDTRIRDCEIIVISDVQNPLCGKNGASFIYGPQKGADPEMVKRLDRNLMHFGNILESHFMNNIIEVPGAGAAGGLGAGLYAFCHAILRPGFETIADIVGLEEAIMETDLVITGEGKLDYQTKFGKVPFGVARMANKYKKPVIGIAGALGKGYQELYNLGFQSIFSISEQPGSLNKSLRNAKSLLFSASERIIRLISIDI